MSKISRLMLALTLLVSVGLANTATPAAAYTAVPAGYGLNLETGAVTKMGEAVLATCAQSHLCFFDGANGGGAMLPIPASWSGCRSMAGSSNPQNWMDNKTSYIANRTSYRWHVWQVHLTNCIESGSTWAPVYPHSTGNMNAQWNNVITTYERQ